MSDSLDRASFPVELTCLTVWDLIYILVSISSPEPCWSVDALARPRRCLFRHLPCLKLCTVDGNHWRFTLLVWFFSRRTCTCLELFLERDLSLLRLLSPQSVGLLLGLGFLPSLSSHSSVKPLSLSLLLLESFNSSLLIDPELFLTFFLQYSLLSTPLEQSCT